MSIERTDSNLVAPAKQPPMAEALSYHDAAIDRLGSVVEVLEQRLQPALNPMPVQEQTGNDRKHASPIVMRIEEHTERVSLIENRLRTLIDQLDI